VADVTSVHVLGAFVPRNPAVARQVLFALTAAATGVTLVFTVLAPRTLFPANRSASVTGTTVAVCLFLLALACDLRFSRRDAVWAWAAFPFLAVGAITGLDLLSADASVAAQVFFLLPVLYAGAQLRYLGVVCVSIAVTAGVTIVNVVLGSGWSAIANTCFVAAALAVTAGALAVGGRRTDQLIARLEQQATVDSLTGLFTRRALDRAAQVSQSADELGLLVLDLDNFKKVNDVHGHLAGDAVLQQLGALLTDVSRRSDAIARMGGDEIAMLLPGCSLDAAYAIADEVLRAIRNHRFDVSQYTMTRSHAPTVLHLTASAGVAHLPTDADTLAGLYAVADAGLYDAKACGRDRVGRVSQEGPHAAA
jgi:diguanylate cyclase (GGDEF)-like protein